jgi:hypothetical protein
MLYREITTVCFATHTKHITRLAIKVDCNTETLLRDHCCRGKAVSMKYYQCMPVFLPYLTCMQIASFLRCIILSSVTCVLDRVFLRYLISPRFSKKKVIEHKMCFEFLYNFCLKYISFEE